MSNVELFKIYKMGTTIQTMNDSVKVKQKTGEKNQASFNFRARRAGGNGRRSGQSKKRRKSGDGQSKKQGKTGTDNRKTGEKAGTDNRKNGEKAGADDREREKRQSGLSKTLNK